MYQNVTEGKLIFFDNKLSKSSEFYCLEPGLYNSITDIVEAMNILNRRRHNHSKTCIENIVSWRLEKVEIHLANERSGLAFLSTDLGHVFRSIVGIEFGIMLRGKWPHQPEFAYNIVRITLSWHTPTWLSTISFGTQRFHCCVAFFLFRKWRWRHSNYWTVHELSDI